MLGVVGYRLLDLIKTLLFALCGVVAFSPVTSVATGFDYSHSLEGSANVKIENGSAIINVNTEKAILEWNHLDAATPKNALTFIQPSSSSMVLNIVNSGMATKFNGTLNANGQVMIINRSGMIFGKDSVVNAASFMASSLELDTVDFDKQRFTFKNGETAGHIVNRGLIQAASGGSVTLLGNTVSNEGVIAADLGQVNLGSGQTATVDFDGDNLITFAIDGNLLSNNGQSVGVENSGEVSASTILLTSKSAAGVFDYAVNNEGLLKADTVLEKGGEIHLIAEDATVVNAGTIEAVGETGEVGGTVHLLGKQVGLFGDSSIDVSGGSGGGTVLVGGDYQGKGDTYTADYTVMSDGSSIKANATDNGNGGKVILWADKATQFFGSIEARAGPNGGDGGFVETSGKEFLTAQGSVDAGSDYGEAGLWLLDPTDVTINASSSDGSFSSGIFDFSPADPDSANVNVNDLLTALDSTNVEILTASDGFGSGSITVGTAINFSGASDRTLTLTADNGIFVNSGVTDSAGGGNLSLVFDAGNITSSGGITVAAAIGVYGSVSMTTGSSGTFTVNASSGITTNGGALNITANDIVIDTDSGALNSGSGLITMTTTNDVGLGTDVTGAFNLSDAELGRITTSGGLTINTSNSDTTEAIVIDSVTSGNTASITGTTTLNASHANSGITLADTGASAFTDDVVIQAGSGDFNIDDSETLTAVNVTINPSNSSTAMSVGGSAAFNFAASDVGRVITSGVLTLGDTTNTASLTISSDATAHASTSTLHLKSAGAVTATAGGIIADELAITASGAVNFTDASTDVDNLAIDTATGNINFTDLDDLTITTVDGVVGVDTDSGTADVTSVGLTVNQALASTGAMTLDAGSGTFTTGSSGALSTTNSLVSITAAGMALDASSSIASGSGGISILPSAVTTVGLGGGAGTFSLTDAELDTLSTSGTLTIGNANVTTMTIDGWSAHTNISGPITLLATNDDDSGSEGSITFSGSSSDLTSGSSAITLNASDGVTLNANVTTDSAISINADADTTDGVGDFTIADGVTLTSGSTAISIEANDLVLTGSGNINSGSAGTTFTLSDNGALTLGSTDDQVTASLFTVDAQTNSGSIIIGGNLAFGATDVHLKSAGTITRSASEVITGTGLAITAAGAVTLTGNNDVDNLAIDTSTGNISFTDSDGLTITTIDGVVGIDTDSGTVDLTTGGTLTLSQAVVGTGDITFAITGDLDQNADVITTAGSVDINASGAVDVEAGDQIIAGGNGTSISVTGAGITVGAGSADNESIKNSGTGTITLNSTGAGGMTLGSDAIETGSGLVSLVTAATVGVGSNTAGQTVAMDDTFLNSITTTGGISITSTNASSTAIVVDAFVETDVTSISGGYTFAATDSAGGIEFSSGASTFSGGLTINADAGFTINQDVTAAGTINIDADLDNSGSGVFTVGSGATLSAGNNAINITASNLTLTGTGAISSGTASTTFTASTAGGLTLDATDDQVTAGTYTIDSNGGTLTIGAALDFTGATDVVFTGGTIHLDADVTSRDISGNSITFSNAVEVGNASGVIIDTDHTNDGDVTFASTILMEDGGNLSVTAGGGDITLSGAVTGTSDEDLTLTGDQVSVTTIGASNEVNTVAISGATSITLNGDITTSDAAGNSVTLTGPVILGANVAIDTNAASNDGAITFGGTLDATSANTETLTLDSGGANIDFDDIVGGTALGAITITAANNVTADAAITASSLVQSVGSGTTTLSGDITTSTSTGVNLTVGTIDLDGLTIDTSSGNGVIDFNGAVTLSSAGTILTAGSGAIDFSSTVNGTQTLGITTTGNIDFNNTVGNSAALGAITISNAGNLTFDNTVDAASLTQSAGSGTTTLSGDITTSTSTGVNLTAGTIDLDGLTIDTSTGNGVIDFNGAVTLSSAGTILTAGSGAIDFSSTVNGTQTLDITTTGNIDFNNTVGNSAALGAITISNADDLTFDNTVQAASLTQSAGSGTTTLSGAVTSSGVVSLTTSGITISDDVTGNGTITLNAGSGALSVAEDATVSSTDNAINITAGTIALNDTASGGDIFNIDSGDAATTIATAGTVGLGSGSGTLSLTNAELANINASGLSITTSVASTNSGITVNGVDGTGTANTGDITLTASDANSGITFVTGDSTFASGLTLDTGASADIELGTSLTTTAGTISTSDALLVKETGQTITAGGSGDISLTGAITSDSSEANSLTLVATGDDITLGTIGSGSNLELGALTITDADNVTFNSTVEAASLTQSAGSGTTTLSGDVTTSTSTGVNLTASIIDLDGLTIDTSTGNGVIDFNGAVTLSSAGTILTAGSGAIDFSSTVNGTQTLGITTTGNIDFNGAVGGDETLGAITISNAGNLTFDNTVAAASLTQSAGSGTTTLSGDITTSTSTGVNLTAGTIDLDGLTIDTSTGNGVIDFNGAVTLSSAGTILTAGSGAIDFSSTVNGTQTLGITTTGNIDFNNTVGNSAALGAITISNADNLTFNNTVDAASITQSAGSGTTTLSGDITTSTSTGVNLTAGTIDLDGLTIDTSTGNGVIDFNGAVTLSSAGTVLTAGSGNIDFSSTVNGTQTLGITTTGNIDFNNTVGNSAALGAITISNADDLTFDNTVQAASLTQSAGSGTTTLSGAVTSSGVVSLTTSGITISDDVTGNGTITLNAGSGALSVAEDATVSSTDNAINITAGTIALNDTASGGDIFNIDSGDAATTIATAGTVGLGSGSGTLSLTNAELANINASGLSITTSVASTNSGITVNGVDGTGTANTGDITLTASDANSGITFVTGDSTFASGLTLNTGNSADIELGASIATTAGSISTSDAITLSATGKSITAGGSGNTITLDTIDSATSTNNSLDLTTTNGNITTGNIGATDNLGAVTIDAGTGEVSVGSISTGAGAVSITSGIFGNSGEITSATDTTITNSGLATLSGDITTTDGDVNITGAVSLGAGIAIDTSGDNGSITFGDIVDGTQTLTLTAGTGDIDFDGIVGGDEALGAVTIVSARNVTADLAFSAASLTQSAGSGTTTLSGDVTTTAAGGVDITATNIVLDGLTINTTSNNGGIAFTGAVDLTSGATNLTSHGTGNISFSSTLTSTGDQDLTLVANTGDITFSGAVGSGSDNELGAIAITSADAVTASSTIEAASLTQSAGSGTTTLSGDVTTSTSTGVNLTAGTIDLDGLTIDTSSGNGVIDFNGAVTLSSAGTVLTAGSGDIDFSSTVDGTQTLGITTTGNIDFNGAVGGDETLGAITISNADDLIFDNTVAAESITQSAGSGTTTLSDDVTTSTSTGVNLTAGTIDLDGLIIDTSTGNGVINFNGAVTLSTAGTTLTAGAGDIDFSSTVNGTQTLGITTTGDIDFNNTVGNSAALGAITISNAGNLTFDNTVDAASLTQSSGSGITTLSGDITTSTSTGVNLTAGTIDLDGLTIDTSSGNGVIDFNGAVTLSSAGTVLTAGSGAIDFSSTVDGTQTLDITTTGNIDFNGAVGGDETLGAITISNAGNLTFDNTVQAASITQSAGSGTTTLSGDITTTTSTGVNLTAATIDLDGLTIDTSTGNGVIDFNGAVTLSSAGTILTAGSGNIDFSSTVDGTQTLGITTTGHIDFNDAVGGDETLGAITISNADDLTFDNTVDAASITQSAGSGTTALSGDVTTSTSTGVNLTAGTIDLDGLTIDTSSGNGVIDLNGAVTLSTGAITLTAGSGAIDFSSTVNGAQNLILTTTGTAALNGVVGGTSALTDLDITAATTTLGGDVTLADSSSMSVSGNLELTKSGTTTIDTNLDDTGTSGSVTIVGETYGSADGRSLTIDTSGTTDGAITLGTFGNNSASGGADYINTLTLTGGEAAVSFSGAVQTDAAIAITSDTFSNGGAITAGTSFTLTNSGTAIIANDITGDTGITFNGAGGISLGATLTTNNSAFTTGTSFIQLTADSTITTGAGAGNITLDEILTDTDGDHVLTLTAGSGSITFNDNIGANVNSELAGLTITSGGAILFNGSAATIDVIDLTIGSSSAVTSVEFDGAVAADGVIDINTGTFQNDATVVAGSTFTLTNTGTAAINTDITSTGAMSFDSSGDITLGADLTGTAGISVSSSNISLTTGARTLTTTNNDISLGGTVNGAQDLVLNAGSGDVTLGGVIGGSTELTDLDITAATTNIGGNISLADSSSMTVSGKAAFSADTIIDTNPNDADTSGSVTISGESYATTTGVDLTIDTSTSGTAGAISLGLLGDNSSANNYLNSLSLNSDGATDGTIALTGSSTNQVSGAVTITGPKVSFTNGLTADSVKLVTSDTASLGSDTGSSQTIDYDDTYLGSFTTTSGLTIESTNASATAIVVDTFAASDVSNIAGGFTLTTSNAAGGIQFDTGASTFIGGLTVNADAGINVDVDITNSTSGNIALDGDADGSDSGGNDNIDFASGVTVTSAGSITLDATTNGIASGTSLILNADAGVTINDTLTAGGTVTVDADTGDDGTGTFTVASGKTVNSSGSNGALSITAGDVDLSGSLSSGSGTITFLTSTTGKAIELGESASSNFALTDEELNNITTTGNLVIGATTNTGGITLTAFTNDGDIDGSYSLLTSGDFTLNGTVNITGGATNALTIEAEDFVLTSGTISGVSTGILSSADDGAISVGTSGTSGTTDIPDAFVDAITASTIQIGDSGSGALTVAAALAPAGTSTLHLKSGSTVTASGGAITVTNLAVTAAGEVNLSASNDIDSLAIDTSTGDITFVDSDGVTVASIGGQVSGIDTDSGNIDITTDGLFRVGSLGVQATGGTISIDAQSGNIDVDDGKSINTTDNNNITLTAADFIFDDTDGALAVNAGSGIVTLLANGNGAISLGQTVGTSSNTEITADSLTNITAGTLRIGDDESGGSITVVNDIAPAGVTNLHLRSNSTITANSGTAGQGGLTATNLAVTAGGQVNMLDQSITVSSVAASTGDENFAFANSSGVLTIGTVDGVSGITANRVDVSSAGGITVSQDVDSTGSRAVLSNSTGTFTVDSGASVTANSGSFEVYIYADDLALSGTISGSTVYLYNTTADKDFGLGADVSGGFNISGSELQNITATTLRVGRNSGNTAGDITVNGISAANSNNIGTVTLQAWSDGSTISFSGSDSTFNALTAQADAGITVGTNLTTDTGNMILNADYDSDATGDLTVSSSQTVTTTNNDLTITANDIDLSGSIAAGSGDVTVNTSNDVSLGTAIADTLALTNAELNRITAATVTIDSTDATNSFTVNGLTTGDTDNIATLVLTASDEGNSGEIDFVTANSAVNGALNLNATNNITVDSGLTIAANSITANNNIALEGAATLSAADGITLGDNVTVTNSGSGTVTILADTDDDSNSALTFGDNTALNFAANDNDIVIVAGTLAVTDGDNTVTITNDTGDVTIAPSTAKALLIGSDEPESDFNIPLNILASITSSGTLKVGTHSGDGAATASSITVETNAIMPSTVTGTTEFWTSGTFTTTGNFSSAAANGDILVDAADLALTGTLSSGTGAITINQASNGTIDLGGTSGAMDISDTELDLMTAGTLNIGAADHTSVTISGAISPAATTDLNIAGTVINLNADVSTADISGNSVTFTGPVNVGADVTIDTNHASNDGSITFTSTVNGGNALTLDAGAGNIDFDGIVGGSTALGAINITSAANVTADAAISAASLVQAAGTGTTTLTGDVTTTASAGVNITNSAIVLDGLTIDTSAGNGAIDFNGPVTLSGGAATLTAGSGNIDFSSTINGAQDLSITTTGTLGFNGAVGSSTALGTLTVSSGGTTIANSITTAANENISFAGDVTVSAGTPTLTAGAGGSITFSDGITLNSNTTLTSDTIAFNGAANSVTGSSQLTLVPASTSSNDTTVASSGGTINFANNVFGAFAGDLWIGALSTASDAITDNITLSRTLSSAGDVYLVSKGAITFGNITTSGDVILVAESGDIIGVGAGNHITATGVELGATGTIGSSSQNLNVTASTTQAWQSEDVFYINFAGVVNNTPGATVLQFIPAASGGSTNGGSAANAEAGRENAGSTQMTRAQDDLLFGLDPELLPQLDDEIDPELINWDDEELIDFSGIEIIDETGSQQNNQGHIE